MLEQETTTTKQEFSQLKVKKQIEKIYKDIDNELKLVNKKPGYLKTGYFPTTKIREHLSKNQLCVPKKLLIKLSENKTCFHNGKIIELNDNEKNIVIYLLSYIVYLIKSQIKRIESNDTESVPRISDNMNYYTNLFKQINKSYKHEIIPIILITRKRLSLMFGSKNASVAISYLMDNGIIQRLDVNNDNDYRIYVNELQKPSKGTILEDLEYLNCKIVNISINCDESKLPTLTKHNNLYETSLSMKQIAEEKRKIKHTTTCLHLNKKQTDQFHRFNKVINYDVPVLEYECEELRFLIEGLFRAKLPKKYINIFNLDKERFILDYCKEDIMKHCSTNINFNKTLVKEDLLGSSFTEKDYIEFIKNETDAIDRFIEWQNSKTWEKYSYLATCIGDRVFAPVNLIPSGLRKYLVYKVGKNRIEHDLDSRDVSTSIPRVVSMLTIDFLKDKIKNDIHYNYPSTIEKAIESDLLLHCIENDKNIYEEFSKKTGMNLIQAKSNFLSMLNGKKDMQKHMIHLPMVYKYICSLKRDNSYMMDNYNEWCEYYNNKDKKMPKERLKYIYYNKITEDGFTNRNIFTKIKLSKGRFQSEENKYRKGGYNAKILRSGNLLYETAYRVESDIMKQAIAILKHEYNITTTSIHDELLFLKGYGDIVEEVLFRVSNEAYNGLKMKVK